MTTNLEAVAIVKTCGRLLQGSLTLADTSALATETAEACDKL